VTVDVRVAGGVAILTLDRPDRLNALDEPMRLALARAVREADAEESVGAILLTGAGRAFCAGQDLTAHHELDDAADTVTRTYNPMAQAITEVDTPVIAAVNGAAVGAGMGIALACDVILLSDRAFFASVFGQVALVPDTGVAWQLVRTLGYPRAYDLVSTGRRVDAAEALALGLATEVVPADSLMERARQRAAELAAGPRLAQALTKRILRTAEVADLPETLTLEARSQGVAARDEEHLRRRAAFLSR
jgi:2-(1,2-epoxy-1,2-dihydrophenyl)acetyl-CoA isomerase